MEATVRQRVLRVLVLMLIGLPATLFVSLDPLLALRDGAFWAMFAGMFAWTVTENVVLRQDEPKDYHGKRGTRVMQAAVMLTIVLSMAERYHLAPVLPRTAPVVAVGLAVLLLGALVRVVAIRTLAEHFRYELRVEDDQRLMDRGLYAVLRHPSYLGLILLTMGAALTLSSLLGALAGGALMAAVTVWRIREEEAVLRGAFGSAYDEYSGRTWRLVPYVY